MISFRYHVTSIVAVFLAITLGIFIGSSVVSGSLVDRLRTDVERARDARDEAQDRNTILSDDASRQRSLLSDEIGPWAIAGALANVPVVYVFAAQEPESAGVLRARFQSAGARDAGSVTLTTALLTDTVVPETLAGIGISTVSEQPISVTVAKELGVRLATSSNEFLDGLATAGAITVDRKLDGQWPPAGTVIVALSDALQGSNALAEFSAAAALATPVVVVSLAPESSSAVDRLKEAGAPMLSTFDSLTLDVSGVGVVASAIASIRSSGGKFGTGEGLRFLPSRS